MMWKTFSLHVTPYCWENVKEQGREYGPLELTNKALCPYLYHVKIPPLLPEAAAEEDKMLDNAGQRRLGFCFLTFPFIQSGSVPIDAVLPGSSVAVGSWSHVSRALNTNADASYSFKDIQICYGAPPKTTSPTNMDSCAPCVLSLWLSKLQTSAGEVSQLSPPQEVCVRRSMVLSALLSPSFFIQIHIL